MILLLIAAGIISLATLFILKRAKDQQYNSQILESYAEWLKSQPPPKQEPKWHPDPETIKRLHAKYRRIIDPDTKTELALTPVDVERIINLD